MACMLLDDERKEHFERAVADAAVTSGLAMANLAAHASIAAQHVTAFSWNLDLCIAAARDQLSPDEQSEFDTRMELGEMVFDILDDIAGRRR